MGSSSSSSFFFLLFPFTLGLVWSSSSFFFSSSSFTGFGEFGFLGFFFFSPRFSEFGYWGLKETKEKKNVKAAPSYRYGAHKHLKNLSDDKLSDGAKRVRCRELRYFK